MSNFSPFKGRDGTSWHLALVHCMPRGRFEVPSSLTWSHPTLVSPSHLPVWEHPPPHQHHDPHRPPPHDHHHLRLHCHIPLHQGKTMIAKWIFKSKFIIPRLLISCNTLHKELPTRLLLCNSQTIVSYFHTSILSYMKHMIPCTKDYLPDCSPATASKFEIRRDNWVSLFPSQLFCPMIGLTLKTLQSVYIFSNLSTNPCPKPSGHSRPFWLLTLKPKRIFHPLTSSSWSNFWALQTFGKTKPCLLFIRKEDGHNGGAPICGGNQSARKSTLLYVRRNHLWSI